MAGRRDGGRGRGQDTDFHSPEAGLFALAGGATQMSLCKQCRVYTKGFFFSCPACLHSTLNIVMFFFFSLPIDQIYVKACCFPPSAASKFEQTSSKT